MQRTTNAFLIAAIVAVYTCLMVVYFRGERDKLEEEIYNLYLLDMVQSRQIETLTNFELRRTNDKIQQRLKLIKEEYADVPEG